MMRRNRHAGLAKWLCTAAGLLLLAGCQTTGTDDPASIRFRIPPDSRLILHKEVRIPEGRAHVMFQRGAPATGSGQFEVACRFEVRGLGPTVVQPESFLITGSSNQREWFNQPHTMRFYRVLNLKSGKQADILPMVCEYFDWPLQGRPITVRQIQEALGDYFSFEFGPAKQAPGN